MRPGRLAITLITLGLAACSGKRAWRTETPEPPKALPLQPERPAYKPPRDGKLVGRQVEAYLAVLARLEAASARVASPSPAPLESLDATPPDVAAARALGQNPEEFLWVKERVLEAEAAAMTAKLNADVLAMLDRTIRDLKQRRDSAPDEGSKKLLSEQIASFEAEAERVKREAREKEPEPIPSNMKIVEPYRARLRALQADLDKRAAQAKRALPRTP
ncbi:MAG TPA: hypothetical protein VGR00_14080 [Thermoanaerobaculia bacterium]|nr:hypothetical protein [Thermoanaerobaculia bacterium]